MSTSPEDEPRVRPIGIAESGYEPPGAKALPIALLGAVIVFAVIYGVIAWPSSPESAVDGRVPPVGLVSDTTTNSESSLPAAVARPTATTSPPLPPTPSWPDVPLVAETALGTLTMREIPIAEAGFDLWATNPVWTGDGYAFLASGTEEGTHLWTSADGINWSSNSVTSTIRGGFPTRLAATDHGLVTTGWWDPDGPGIWRLDRGLDRIVIPPSPVPTSSWLIWHPDEVRVFDAPDGTTLVLSGTWGASIDWMSLLVPESEYEWWWDPAPGGVVRLMRNEELQRTLQLEATSSGEHLTVMVTDEDTGEVVLDGTADLPGYDMDAVTSQMLDNGGTFAIPTVNAWVLGSRGLEPTDAITSLPQMWLADLAVGESGTVAVGEIPSTVGGFGMSGSAYFSSDGATWLPISEALGFGERGSVHSVKYRDGRFVAIGSVLEIVQLTEQTSARTLRTAVWTSTNGTEWTRTTPIDADQQVLGNAIAVGDMGWAMVSQDCGNQCFTQLSLSPDSVAWSTTPLRDGSRHVNATGVAVGDRTVVMVVQKWDQQTGEGDLAVWTGTID